MDMDTKDKESSLLFVLPTNSTAALMPSSIVKKHNIRDTIAIGSAASFTTFTDDVSLYGKSISDIDNHAPTERKGETYSKGAIQGGSLAVPTLTLALEHLRRAWVCCLCPCLYIMCMCSIPNMCTQIMWTYIRPLVIYTLKHDPLLSSLDSSRPT